MNFFTKQKQTPRNRKKKNLAFTKGQGETVGGTVYEIWINKHSVYTQYRVNEDQQHSIWSSVLNRL